MLMWGSIDVKQVASGTVIIIIGYLGSACIDGCGRRVAAWIEAIWMNSPIEWGGFLSAATFLEGKSEPSGSEGRERKRMRERHDWKRVRTRRIAWD